MNTLGYLRTGKKKRLRNLGTVGILVLVVILSITCVSLNILLALYISSPGNPSFGPFVGKLLTDVVGGVPDDAHVHFIGAQDLEEMPSDVVKKEAYISGVPFERLAARHYYVNASEYAQGQHPIEFPETQYEGDALNQTARDVGTSPHPVAGAATPGEEAGGAQTQTPPPVDAQPPASQPVAGQPGVTNMPWWWVEFEQHNETFLAEVDNFLFNISKPVNFSMGITEDRIESFHVVSSFKFHV